MQIWPYNLILSASLITFFLVGFFYTEKEADFSTITSKVPGQEISPALHLDWKLFGNKKYTLVDSRAFRERYFLTYEAKECERLFIYITQES